MIWIAQKIQILVKYCIMSGLSLIHLPFVFLNCFMGVELFVNDYTSLALF